MIFYLHKTTIYHFKKLDFKHLVVKKILCLEYKVTHSINSKKGNSVKILLNYKNKRIKWLK